MHSRGGSILNGIKQSIYTGLVYLGSGLLALLGGWTVYTKWLVVFMISDFILGSLDARLVKKETFDHLKFWRGMAQRLGYIVILILTTSIEELATLQGLDLHGGLRLTIMAALLGKEAQSILLHLKSLGVDLPPILREILCKILPRKEGDK